jgi:hypothetical protein
MNSDHSELNTADRIVSRFLTEYHNNWQTYFPGLNKRAHWHVIFSTRMGGDEGVSCRAIHRALYGSYGTDIRTCIERIRDCERDGFVRVFDDGGRPCSASAGCLIGTTEKLRDCLDRHGGDTIAEVCSIFGKAAPAPRCDDATIAAIFQFFAAYDQKWRQTSEQIVRKKGLTPAYFNDAMDHLVTYQYWAIVMLVWRTSAAGTKALVIDEINSKMWDALQLGHLAIKERVGNLIRWGFFAEETIRRHKAVSLTPFADQAIGDGLGEAKPLLDELFAKLAARPRELMPARSA